MYILSSACSVSKCMIGPRTPQVVVAGCEEGTLLVWDLRTEEPFSGNPISPSYCTEAPGVGSPTAYHGAQICGLECLSRHDALNNSSFEFQFASLDEAGTANIWTVLDHSVESEVDPGIFVGARLKLHHVDSTHVSAQRNEPHLEFGECTSTARCFAFHPSDTSRIFVGTASGSIVQLARFGDTPNPKSFKLGGARFSAFSAQLTGLAVTSISFHPCLHCIFLVGYNSGTFALFEASSAIPLKVWEAATAPSPLSGSGFSAVSKVRWSTTCPSIFQVLDSSGRLAVWDLSQDITKPLVMNFVAGQGTGLLALSPSSVKTASRQRRLPSRSCPQKAQCKCTSLVQRLPGLPHPTCKASHWPCWRRSSSTCIKNAAGSANL